MFDQAAWAGSKQVAVGILLAIVILLTIQIIVAFTASVLLPPPTGAPPVPTILRL